MSALRTDAAAPNRQAHLPATVLYTFRLNGQAAVVHHTLEQPDDTVDGFARAALLNLDVAVVMAGLANKALGSSFGMPYRN
jgi:hypothetical protein